MDRTTLVGNPPIRKVIFRAELDACLSIQLAEYADGRFGIWNGPQLVDARFWSSAELENCIEAYLTLCRSMAPENAS